MNVQIHKYQTQDHGSGVSVSMVTLSDGVVVTQRAFAIEGSTYNGAEAVMSLPRAAALKLADAIYNHFTTKQDPFLPLPPEGVPATDDEWKARLVEGGVA